MVDHFFFARVSTIRTLTRPLFTFTSHLHLPRGNAARVADHRRSVPLQRLAEERLQVLRVLRLADRQVRQCPQHRDVVEPLMRDAIRTDRTRVTVKPFSF